MIPSFYLFALNYRGGNDAEAIFAERMFHDHTFPKQSDDFQELSRYVEEQADEQLSAVIFDELWGIYESKYFF